MLAQTAEIGVFAEEFGEFSFRRVVLGAEVGRHAAIGGFAGEEPFEGEARVQGKQLAEAEGEFAVFDDATVSDRDAVVIQPAFESGTAGCETAGPGTGHAAPGRRVENGLKIGQTGAEAKADMEGAGLFGAVGGDFGVGGNAAEGWSVGP